MTSGDVATAESSPRIFPTALTVLRALVVARWFAWAWMAAVVAVSQSRDALDEPIVAWLAVAAVGAAASWSTFAVRRDPEAAMSAPFVVCETLLAVGLSIIDGWVFEPGHVFVTSQSLATQYPLIAMVSIGLAAGPWVAAAVGIAIGPAELLAAVLNEFDGWSSRHYYSILATSIFFGVAGAVFGWQARLLRDVEREIADQRARDDVAGVLHDTVLQTLALVENRSSDTDPELARAARDADRELRRFLFGATARTGDDLDGRIRAAVERSSRHHDITVTVNVLDLGCTASEAQQDALAGAVGEAVTNAIKHAGSARIVVFAETDDDGAVFASVRDDGCGFDTSGPTAAPDRHGIAGSITGRMASVGGVAEIESTPGVGTEVRIWTSSEAPSTPQRGTT